MKSGRIEESTETFITSLTQMYQGTKKWGSIKITMKRCKFRWDNRKEYEEKFQHKKSKSKDRKADQALQNQDSSKEFTLLVRAQSPRKKVTVFVPAQQALGFTKQLTALQASQMFKDLKRQGVAKKDKKKVETKTTGKKDQNQMVQKIKKNRAERRKDLKKLRRKEVKAKIKEEKKKLNEEEVKNDK